ncbi:MAG: PAS domain-containing protein [Nitriliruptorales bacterium]|nr:PAS domain-containing protein [Nitriliruptorales bacterium]
MDGSLDAATLASLPDPAVVVDSHGRVTHCTTLAARLLHTTAGDVIGRPAADVVPLADESGQDWWKFAMPLDGDPARYPRIPQQDLILTTAGGGTRPVMLTAARIPGENGTLAHLVVLLRRAEVRQRLDAARSDLVSTVSHEIRSPLTSVKGFVKTLLAKWDRFDDDQKRQMLATVNEDADRVTRLLGELLDVSRIDAGRLQLRRQMVDVRVIAERVADRLSTAGEHHDIQVGFSSDFPHLYADPDKIEQVLTNLTENALKYGAGRTTIRGWCDDERATVVVSDEGGGIPQQYLGQIFTKFFRRAGERRTGTGLGLYITKGIIEAHGGRIWATSMPGEGANMHFTLPLGGLELAGIDVGRRP